MADKIEELRKKKQKIDEQASKRKKQIDARIRQIHVAESRKDRKLDNRKKLLEGVALRAWVGNGRMSKDEYTKLLDEGLTLNRDRELFGLPLKAAPAPPSPPAPKKPEEAPQNAQEQKTPGKVEDRRVYLKATYADRKAVKELGAKWAPKPVGAWYVSAGVDLKPFKAWLPEGEAAAASSAGVQAVATTGASEEQGQPPAQSNSAAPPAAPPSKPAAPGADAAPGAPALSPVVAGAEERKSEARVPRGPQRRKKDVGPPDGKERRAGVERRGQGKASA